MNTCPQCGTAEDTKEFAAIAQMMRCINCRLDIAMGGTWTGIGRAAMASIAKAHGRARVVKEYKFLRDGAPKKKQPFRTQRPGRMC